VLLLFAFNHFLPIKTNMACHAKSYNNFECVRKIIGTDHSGFTEPILTTENHHLINSWTTIDNELLKIDSTECNRRAEGAKGKRPLGFILQKLGDKWLDILAKQRWKQNVPNSWVD
jgi:hypothetical protein